VIRIGVAAQTAERRQQLIIGVLGALSTAEDRGTYMELIFEPAGRLNLPRLPWRWNLRLGATELTGLLGWPLGERDLPGVAPLHPRPLRNPEKVNRTERLFAVPGAPGPTAPVGIAARDITAHMLAIGPTGVGKSTVLLNLVAADISAGRPVLVIDLKWQLIRDVIERAIPKERIDDVVIIDPAEATTGKVVGFNPLNVGDRDPDVVIDGLVAVLKEVFSDGWGPRPEDIIHSALLTRARVGAPRKTPFTMLDLPRLLAGDKFRRTVIGEVTGDPGLGSFWSCYLVMSAGAQVQAIAAPMNKLRQYLLRPSLRAILGQPDPAFRLRDVFKENKIVLAPLNEALIGPITAQLLGSLIVAETCSATLERANEDDPASRPATVVIDEVQQYLHLPVSIDDVLCRSRSYGVGRAPGPPAPSPAPPLDQGRRGLQRQIQDHPPAARPRRRSRSGQAGTRPASRRLSQPRPVPGVRQPDRRRLAGWMGARADPATTGADRARREDPGPQPGALRQLQPPANQAQPQPARAGCDGGGGDEAEDVMTDYLSQPPHQQLARGSRKEQVSASSRSSYRDAQAVGLIAVR
jgi:hypothetical protein